MLKYLKVNMNKMKREKHDINLKEIYRLDNTETKSSENGKLATESNESETQIEKKDEKQKKSEPQWSCMI